MLTDADKQAISGNSFNTYYGNEIKFSLDGSDASAIDLRGITTAGDLRNALTAKINDLAQYDAVDNGDGTVTITQSAVRAIVEQLTPELDHYTEVEVGRPASVLNVLDKRRGDIEVGGKLYRAQILPGVLTNFLYTHKEEFIPDPTDGVPVDFRSVGIYAGSEPEPQIINVRLPYLTLDNLKLTEPDDPDLSTTEAAAVTMQHVIDANNAIAYARGTIGADFNRLEHAHANLTQSEVQMTDAYSRIRDADMAEEMMQKVRVSILQQAQQTTLMHSMRQPQQVISLLGA